MKEDLHKRVAVQATFNEQSMQPMRKNGNNTMTAGSGLTRSGAMIPQGGFAIAAPLISGLVSQAVPGLAKGIWSGVKKVGKWFKHLFGKGDQCSGGMRERRADDNTDAPYHNMRVNTTGMRMQDIPVQGYDVNYKSKRDKYQKWLRKADMGEGVNYTEGGVIGILQDPKLQESLMRYKHRPHKFMNVITRALREQAVPKN